MSKLTKPCIFCGRDSVDRANEHVVPKWLLKRIGPMPYDYRLGFNKIGGPGIIEPGDYLPSIEPLEIRKHPFVSLVNGVVCKDCNSKWMSQLEVAVQGNLIRLIEGTKRISDLSIQDKEILARWVVKTAYSWHFTPIGMPNVPSVPDDHPLQFGAQQGRRIPEGVFVIGRQFRSHAYLNSCFSSDWECRLDGPEYIEVGKEIRKRSYKLSFQILNLHLMVAYWDSRDWSLLPVRQFHELIYPEDAKLPWIDTLESIFGNRYMDRVLDRFHMEFHRTLCVKSPIS